MHSISYITCKQTHEQTDPAAPRHLATYARQLLQAEGVSFVWRGLGANMLAIGLSSGVRVGLYPVVRDAMSGGAGQKHALSMTAASMATGMFGYWCSTPLYQAKVCQAIRRMQLAKTT